jgi:uncharacterized protein YraI
MQNKRIGLIVALAAGLLALGVEAASAAPGEATAKANVRQGPGTQYKIVDSVKAGELVDIAKCVDGWCYIGKVGTDGWVAQAYLKKLAPVFVPPPIIIHPPVVHPPIVIRPPHHRPPHHRPPHHRPPVKPPVCKPGKMLPGCLHPLPGPKT